MPQGFFILIYIERDIFMKKIQISDMTLTYKGNGLSFKEKIEIVRQLSHLNVDCIEIPVIENARVDTLFIRTVSSFVKNSILSVCAGMTIEGVELAAAALSCAEKARIKIAIPISTVGMEYDCHLKPPKVIELIAELINKATEKCKDVEFCALDATRADPDFLIQTIETALTAGANAVTVCDNAAEMLPDEFSEFINMLIRNIPSLSDVIFGVACDDNIGMAAASEILAAKAGATMLKTSVEGNAASFITVTEILKNCPQRTGLSSGIKYTELRRGTKQIEWILGSSQNNISAAIAESGEGPALDKNDEPSVIIDAVRKLGYELSDEDYGKVCEEFRRVAEKKTVTSRELDAIVASVALQVPPTYKLISYVINNGNIISASAQIKLSHNDDELTGIGIGDGPIDASFRTIEQIVGHHYELDDFQIQSVTEGREAMGSALVRLREGGKLYSGNGISTDIIGASIRAYINALNKIVYEEA